MREASRVTRSPLIYIQGALKLGRFCFLTMKQLSASARDPQEVLMIPNVCPDMWDYTVLDWIHSNRWLKSPSCSVNARKEAKSRAQTKCSLVPRSHKQANGCMTSCEKVSSAGISRLLSEHGHVGMRNVSNPRAHV